ncbi:hypothetical protein CAPTEDRAFT_215832 [Capitella teleta]|uniref:Major facilitator superfamily (MFS) profile domain-containing protein n=1 Tax=Capitella teleta TaxID=283909 RepID=R7USG4_CAPTE|nr:hypothetical protein CAPTEDRAFT_215832 [Capitella teleta]|eukprot:ELU06867.1 hypothetical protein CAPTEDRAFT_215832 [Capitella teleta]
MDARTDSKRRSRRVTSERIRGALIYMYCMLSGTAFALIGTTQPDLAALHGFTLSQMSFGLCLFCIGVVIGSLTGTVLSTNYLHSYDIFLATMFATYGVSVLCIPFVPNWIMLSLIYGLQGTLTGMGNVCNVTLIILLWRDKATSCISAYALCYAVGSIISPILASPFLSSEAPLPPESNETAVTSPLLLGSNDTMELREEGDQHAELGLLFVPFLVLGIYGISVAILHLYVRYNFQKDFEARIVESDEVSASYLRSEKSSSWFKRFSSFWFFVVILGFMLYGVAIGREIASLYIFVTITSDAFKISTQSASLITILLNALRCGGRVVMIFLPMFFSMKHLIITYITVPVILSVALVVTGTNWWAYLVLMSLQTLFGSACSPLFMAWVIDIIPQDRSVSGILMYGTGFGALVGVWICSFLYETYGLVGFFYFMLGMACTLMVCVLLLRAGVSYCKNRDEERTQLLASNDKEDGEDCNLPTERSYD